MGKTFALACLVASTLAMSEIESAFLGYITEFGKSYSNMAEYEHRLTNFALMHSVIVAHNATESHFKLGHNKMSDWTEEEYKSILTYKPNMVDTVAAVEASPMGYSPVDWRSGSCLSPVQDQGQCGSCWAFSAVASMENKYCAQNGTLYKLSEQQLVDCVNLCSVAMVVTPPLPSDTGNPTMPCLRLPTPTPPRTAPALTTPPPPPPSRLSPTRVSPLTLPTP